MNGHKNYETYLYSAWNMAEGFRKIAEEILGEVEATEYSTKEEVAIYTLEKKMRDALEDEVYGVELDGWKADVLIAAVQDVDFRSFAEELIKEQV